MELPEGSDRWRHIEELFYAALDLDPKARPGFLQQACGSNQELLKEIESLLESSDKTLTFARSAVVQLAHHGTISSQPAGRRIGAYRLLRPVGEGGMGTVYLATRADEAYRQQVAIKLMHPGLGVVKGMLLRFSNERQILANLNHPNIARLLDGGLSNDGIPYLVMEYVEGAPIDEYCRANRLSIEQRLKLFLSVCEAVGYAHKNLVIHRDIKPANILVTADGVPKLLDFGIAKLLDPGSDAPSATQVSERILTLDYASPEQVRGDQITTATDVYALGLLLYELLAGKLPFRMASKTPVEFARIICEEEPPPPSKVYALPDGGDKNGDDAEKLKGDLDHIVLMALRKEPGRRYSSVGALARDIQAYLTGYSIQARADTWRYRSGKFVRRHRVAVPMTAVGVLALIGFSVAMGLFARRANRERQIAEQQQQVAKQERDFLGGIFEAASPLVARGKIITARDLLDQAAKRIDTQPVGIPEVEAAILDDVGSSYDTLGLYDQAEGLIKRAYDIRKKTSPASVEFAQTANDLGIIYMTKGQFGEAEALLREAVAAARKAPGNHNHELASVLADLGVCLSDESKFAEAQTLLRESVALNPNRDNQAAAEARFYLGTLLDQKGDFTGAEQFIREAMAITEKVEGTDSPDLANQMNEYGDVLAELGNVSAAMAEQQKAVALMRQINSGTADYTYGLESMAMMYLDDGDWKHAEPLMREAHAVRSKVIKGNGLMNGTLNSKLARIEQEKGNYAGADKIFHESLDAIRQSVGADNAWTANILNSLSVLERDRGDYAKSQSYAQQAMAIEHKVGSDTSLNQSLYLLDLGVAKELAGDAAGAEGDLRKSLEIRQKQLPPGHPKIIATETLLGEVLTEEGEAQLAEPLLRDAVKLAHSEPFPLEGWKIAEPENALGVCLARLGNKKEAASLLQQSSAALKAYPDPALRRWMLRMSAPYLEHVGSARLSAPSPYPA